MSFIEHLAPLRAQPGHRLTAGLDDATLERLAASHPQLVAAELGRAMRPACN